jgi:large subunit ribosomal protein L35
MKTHSSAKKRFKKLSSGKVKRGKQGRRHCLSSKNHKRKRHLAKADYVADANMGQMSKMLIY